MRAVVRAAVPVLVLIVAMPASAAAATCPGGRDGAGWTLSTTTFDNHYTRHAYVGNGYLSQRVPPAGTGYMATGEKTGWPLFTPRYDGAFVAGLYGLDPSIVDADGVARTIDAAIPTWSTLNVTVGSETYSSTTPAGRISNFRQELFLGCGLLRTSAHLDHVGRPRDRPGLRGAGRSGRPPGRRRASDDDAALDRPGDGHRHDRRRRGAATRPHSERRGCRAPRPRWRSASPRMRSAPRAPSRRPSTAPSSATNPKRSLQPPVADAQRDGRARVRSPERPVVRAHEVRGRRYGSSRPRITDPRRWRHRRRP